METKLVRKPTTTKTSVGKETVNQTVARAKAMLGSAYDPNTKAPSASRMKEISEQSFIKPEVKKAYDKSVSAMALANTESPTLPVPTVAETPGLNLAVTNASLGQTDATGMYQIPEMTVSETAGAGEQAAVSSVNALGQQIQGYLGINKPEEGASEKALAKAREQAGVQQAQQEFNRYQNQINAITSQRDAQILSLEGQGRGQTQGFIGGEQARISREAAIMALPVQAQLAAAQGNLEQAKELMGQLYQAKSADIQADLSYRTNLVNSLISFASSSQQTVLQAKLADNAQASQIAQQNLAYQRQLGLQALEYGQTGLITGISAIDPKSKTFEQDMARFTAQLRKPVTTTKMSDWELKDVNGVSMWVNKFTQEVKPAGDTAMAGVDGPGGELDKVALLRDTIERIKGRDANEELGEEAYDPLYKSASQTPFTEFFGRTFTGSSDLDNLKVYADTLKANMLTLAADPEIKKFFGPQMSNNDVQQMMAIASRLRPGEMKPEQLLSEVNRLETFVGKYEAAVKAKGGGYTQNSNVVVGADGYEYEIVD